MQPFEPKRTTYLRDELRNILAALHITMQSTANGTGQKVEAAYQQGFTDALRSVALALGLGVEPTESFTARHSRQRQWKISEPTQIEDGS